MKNKKLVYICSPYRGDVEKNTKDALEHCAAAFAAAAFAAAAFAALRAGAAIFRITAFTAHNIQFLRILILLVLSRSRFHTRNPDSQAALTDLCLFII